MNKSNMIQNIIKINSIQRYLQIIYFLIKINKIMKIKKNLLKI